MRNLDKYKGVIPAFYACYDKDGNISPEVVQALTKYFAEKASRCVCKWLFRRVHLPERRGPQDCA